MKEPMIFGRLDNGDIASRFVLENRNGMRIEVSDFGALVLSIVLKDKNGVLKDVVLGFENLEDYFQTDTGMGAYVGRNANRIKNASLYIKGIKYTLESNDGNNNLHSGFVRSHCKMYDARCGKSREGKYVELRRLSPKYEQGFPGDRKSVV